MAENGRKDRERTEHGYYAEEYPPKRVLAVFEDAVDPCEPLTASEVAARLDCDRKTAYNKLSTLVEQDALSTKKVGARGRVWWRKGGNDNGR